MPSADEDWLAGQVAALNVHHRVNFVAAQWLSHTDMPLFASRIIPIL
jgi:hypothetical protein